MKIRAEFGKMFIARSISASGSLITCWLSGAQPERAMMATMHTARIPAVGPVVLVMVVFILDLLGTLFITTKGEKDRVYKTLSSFLGQQRRNKPYLPNY